MDLQEALQKLVDDYKFDASTEYKFWKTFLDFFNEIKAPFSFDSYSEELDVVLNYIQELCDIKDEDFKSQLYTALKDMTEAPLTDETIYWNQSLQDLILFFKEKMEAVGEDTVLLPINGEQSITVLDLKNANAGNSFQEHSQYVTPWINQNEKSYDDVRKKDAVLTSLTKENKTQFTLQHQSIEAAAKWIRLLMPQYAKIVEIEDLNRNFWVISQSISAISNYLFDDDAALPKFLKGIIRELSEQWENLMYLWMYTAAKHQKESDSLRIIVLPLTGMRNRMDKRYDDINKFLRSYFNLSNPDLGSKLNYKFEFKKDIFQDFQAEVKAELMNHVDEYCQANVLFIPYIRLDNYKHNYYKGEYYPGAYLYKQSADDNDKWKFYEFQERIIEGENEVDIPLIISPYYEYDKRFSQRIYGINQLKNGRYTWDYPYASTHEIISDEKIQYLYGALRTTLTDNGSTYEKRVFRGKLQLHIEDVGSTLVNECKTDFGYYESDHDEEKDIIYFTFKDNPDGIITPDDDKKYKINHRIYTNSSESFYLGEVSSSRLKTVQETTSENLFRDASYVVKIGNFLPKSANNNPSRFKMASVVYNEKTGARSYTSMAGNVTTTGTNISTQIPVCYYRFPWEHYDASKDGDTSTTFTPKVGEICYRDENGYVFPQIKKLEYLSENNLRYDGLVAAKALIASDPEKQKQPCYILSTLGLCPWDNGTNNNSNVYWSVAGVCHLFLYVPKSDIFISNDKKMSTICDTTEYDTEYNKHAAITASNSDETATPSGVLPDIDGTILDKDGKEIGKIIFATKIDRYEGYFSQFGLSDSGVYQSGAWRQFFVFNDSDSGNATNTCIRVEANVGIDEDDIRVRYTNVKFSKVFNGYVKYYDARYNQNEVKEKLPNEESQVSIARIRIDDEYSQIEPGQIVACSQKKTFYSRITNPNNHKQTYDMCTGFQSKYNATTKELEYNSFMDKPVEQFKDKTTGLFYGATYNSNQQLSVYVEPSN